MIQHAPATARLCARRSFLRVWQMPFASRLALKAVHYEQHSLKTGGTNASYVHQRLFSMTSNPNGASEEPATVPRSQAFPTKLEGKQDIKLESEKLGVPMYDMPKHDLDADAQTIYALSTGAARAAIAIIRISGPKCIQVRWFCYTGTCFS